MGERMDGDVPIARTLGIDLDEYQTTGIAN